jgi:hypothetical protein
MRHVKLGRDLKDARGRQDASGVPPLQRMTSLRRSLAALTIVVTSVGSVGAWALVTAAPAAALPSCNDNWTNASGGTWSASDNWSAGVPTSTSEVCIDLKGTYTVDFSGSGSAETLLVGNAASGRQTLDVDGSSTSSALTLGGASAIASGGVLSETPSGNGYALLGASGSASLKVNSGGEWQTSGSGNNAYLRVPITIDAGGTAQVGSPATVQDSSTLTTNDGTFTVSSGGGLSLSGNSSFSQSAGTLKTTGSFTDSSGTFTMSGGTESGNPVDISGGALVDSAGGGSFDLTGGVDLSGKIPSGQTVTVDGLSTSVAATLSGPVTDDGTLTLDSSGNGYSMIEGSALTVGSHGALTTTGSGNISYLRAPITIDAGGTATIGNPTTNQDSGTATTNAGTLQVSAGAELTLSGSSTLTNDRGATLGVTVDATTGAWGVAAPSGSISLAGTLGVTTVGSPTLRNSYDPITGTISGTFSSFAFGPKYYLVTYPTSEVQVQIEQGFTSSFTSFSPAENESITPQIASIAHANDEPGAYSATVNYGDGSGVEAATVKITGATGTVTGPAHTFTKAGTYSVTVVVSNTSGTTDIDTKVVTVTGPTIEALSKDTVAPGKELVTTITGTNFDGTGAPHGFSTSDPTHVTVASVKYENATQSQAAEYIVTLKVAKTASEETLALTLTQTGSEAGEYTDPDAVNVT